MRRRDTARIFRAAKRHSRLVRFLRVSIPAGTAIAAVGLALLAWLDPLSLFGTLPVKLSDLVISGTKIRMEQPRMSGYTRDARPYDLTAQYAAQDITKPDLIELSELRAKMEMQDSSVVQLSAAAGLYNTKSEILNLDRDIVVTSNEGITGTLSHAVVDTRKGTLVSNKPVTITMRQGTIRSNGMEIEQSGEVIRFTGGVAVMLQQPPAQPAAAAQAVSQ